MRGILLSPPTAMQLTPLCGYKQCPPPCGAIFSHKPSLRFPGPHQVLCPELPPPGLLMWAVRCVKLLPGCRQGPHCAGGQKHPPGLLETQRVLSWWTHTSSVMAGTTTPHRPQLIFCFRWHVFRITRTFSGFVLGSVFFCFFFPPRGPHSACTWYVSLERKEANPPPSYTHMHTHMHTHSLTSTLSVY